MNVRISEYDQRKAKEDSIKTIMIGNWIPISIKSQAVKLKNKDGDVK